MAGVYIHIPFCVRKCPYCDFYSIPYQKGLMEDFIDALLQEIGLCEADEEIETIYLGGGTPSLMDPVQIEVILKGIFNHFRVSSEAEITLEANPESLERDKLKDLAFMGVNRLSLGIQSLHDEELRAIGRVHDSKRALKALEEAKEVFQNLSVDIMFGLPGQTLETLQATLERTLQFEPTHISAYELTIHEGTEFYRLQRMKSLKMPDEGCIEDMYYLIVGTLKGAGYEHYEVSNYARKTYRCRHNMNYWQMGHYIGLGPSAHTYYKGQRWENLGDLGQYLNAVKHGRRPIYCLKKLTKRDIQVESLMLGLRTSEGVEKEALVFLPEKIETLAREGLIEVSYERVCLTDRGMILSNRIILELLDALL